MPTLSQHIESGQCGVIENEVYDLYRDNLLIGVARLALVLSAFLHMPDQRGFITDNQSLC